MVTFYYKHVGVKYMYDLISLFAGFILSLFAASIISFQQFSTSLANHRLKEVINATKEFLFESKSSNPNFSPLRNKYRYSLGVVFDDFLSSFGSVKHKIPRQVSKYPALIDPDKDRWTRYNELIRPVLVDLTQHNLFGVLFYLRKFKRLRLLIQFCLDIELLVSQLDQLYEVKPEYFNFENGMKINFPENAETYHTKNLTDSLERLNDSWQAWLNTVK